MSKTEKPGRVEPPTSSTPTSPTRSEEEARGAMAEGTLGGQSKDIEERIRVALRDDTLGDEHLAAAIGEPLDEVIRVTRKLSANEQIANVGGSYRIPRWTLRISNVSPAELRQQIARLIAERPSSIDMLVDATGAPRDSVDAAVSELRRDARYEGRIENCSVGDDAAVWYLHPVQRQLTGFEH